MRHNQLSLTGFNTAILPLTDLKSMRGLLVGDTRDEQRTTERLRLKALSSERVTRWPNTLNAYKTKKDQFRFTKFQKEELERRRVDIEEQEFKLQERNAVLSKANQQIYENNDRVRAFQSTMLFSDALQEREEQIEVNKYKRELLKQQDEIYNEILQDQMLELEQKEIQKKQKLQLKKLDQQKVIKQQHDLMKEKYIHKLKEEKIEGELVKKQVKDAIEEDERVARVRKMKIEQNQQEMFKVNGQIIENKRQAKLREKQEEEQLAIYAEKKHRVAEMRRVREECKVKEKQAQRQRLIDVQTKQLLEIKQHQEQIINKQIVEAEIKAEEIERIKREKMEQMLQMIDKSRSVKAIVKERQAKSLEHHKKEFEEYWHIRNRELEDMERAESSAQKQRRKELQRFHCRQIEEKQITKENEVIEMLDDLKCKKKKLESEDIIFLKWASLRIKEQEEDGKNVLPLIKELKHLAKPL